ncbi:hypothetical protein [Estrella lausannensis]|uniref:Putative bacterial sensory transduction regulator n=1 Tax=Estrella lausannensis TaxID=483423 RepID=A0A0H5E4M4_9BACT|nr:hypothetical protein [Estrella lausannensis]CRX38180.1 Putative bacterial sensory transduction regulator [Estrella lausannensis]
MKTHQITVIDKLLKKNGFISKLRSQEDGDDSSCIMLSLPVDLQGRKREMLIKIEEFEGIGHLKSAAGVQLISILPFSLIAGTEQATIQAVNFFNRGLPSPVFVFDEALRKVFVKYSFLTPAEGATKEMFIPLLRSLILWMDAGSEPIERVAAGEDLLNVIENSLSET